MHLTLPEGDFAAYLFDCDGTIADSMPLHYLAWSEVLSDWKCDFPEDLFYAWGGKPVDVVVHELNAMHGLNMPVDEVVTRKESLYFAQLSQLQGIEEVLEHIHHAHGRIPFAVVSGSPRESVVRSLEVLGVLDRFETLVCAGDYSKGKPNPEPFLLAAERLGIAPERCLVFEDAETGIESARRAGMQWVKVAPPWERQPVTA